VTINDLPDRLRSKIVVMRGGSDCWIWTATTTSNGYGVACLNGGRTTAHRAIYELLVGQIDDGLVIDHLCRVRNCVNPAHLEPVTQRENLMRGETTQGSINGSKTHCIRGHEFTPENTYPHPAGRSCRACAAYRASLYREARMNLVTT
jgi:hypothetical protein